MTVAGPCGEDNRPWMLAAAAALAAHIAAAALAFAWARAPAPLPPEPVVLVELPPEAAPAAVAATPQASQPRVAPVRPAPPVSAPTMAAPLPRDAVILPPPAPVQPPRRAEPAPASAAPAPAAAPVAVARAGTGSGTSAAPGSDPQARQQEANYFALVSAHLNRRKTYPAEARKARQQGVVTVRFTVDRAGNVSSVSIKRGSGHDLLDRATLDLLARVAPLPRMPASMPRDSITLSLPIDFALRTI